MTLASALLLCRRAADLSGGAVLVGLSGGKDSLVTLDLCCRTFRRVEAVYWYLVKGIACYEAPAVLAAERAGVKLHFRPSPDLSRMLRSCVWSEPVSTPLVTLRQAEQRLSAETGIAWHARGERADDGLKRRLYLRACGGIREDTRRVFPIWDWHAAEVLTYLRSRGLPQPRLPNTGEKSNGFNLRPRTLAFLKREHPSDYARVLEVFPYVEASVWAYERRAQQVPSVRDAAASASPAEATPRQPA